MGMDGHDGKIALPAAQLHHTIIRRAGTDIVKFRSQRQHIARVQRLLPQPALFPHPQSATAEAKTDYSSAIAALQLKRDEAAEKLQGISAATDDEWEDLKTGTEKVWDEVRTILRDAIMKIK